MNEIKRFKTIRQLDIILAMVMLVFLIALTFVGVFMRYLFSSPIIWQEEVQLWCFVWIVAFGGGFAFRTGSHVAIEILVDLLPEKLARVMEALGGVLVTAILLFLMVQSASLVMQMAETGRTTNILRVPYTLIYSAFPIGCVLMIVNFWLVTADRWRGKKEVDV